MPMPGSNAKKISKSHALKRAIIVVSLFIVLVFGGLAAFLATFDVNQYRDRIAMELSEKTGRKISLYGALSLGLSWNGVTLTVLDASISNPPWASRPVMADIGRFDLGVSLVPLLHHRVVITRLEIAGADIDLEAESGNRDNWDLTPQGQGAETENQPGDPVAVSIDKFSVTKSQVTFYDRDGNARIFKIASMTVGSGSDGEDLALDADYDGTPIVLKLKTGADGLLPPHGSWPFTAALGYANYVMTAEGKADIDGKFAEISRYEVTSGGSSATGQLNLNWQKEVPVLEGTLVSDSIALSDFTSASASTAPPAKTEAKAAPGPSWMFNDTPLPFDGLKAVNADLDVKIGKIKLAKTSLTQFTSKVKLIDGLLAVSPFDAMLGNGTVKGQMNINAGETLPQTSLLLSATGVEFGDLFNLLSLPGIVSGNANVEINLASSGNTTNLLAGNAVGVANLVVAGGNVSGLFHDVSSVLMNMFVPGGSNDLNCIAARFVLKNGIARDNGILADTTSATIAGAGELNLLQETLDLTLHAKTKGVNVGSLLPAAHVTGTFNSPRISVDPGEVVQNITGLVADMGSGGSVPNMQSEPGQNACVYTLDHPAATQPAAGMLPGVLAPTLTGRAGDALKNFGGILKGIMGQQ